MGRPPRALRLQHIVPLEFADDVERALGRSSKGSVRDPVRLRRRQQIVRLARYAIHGEPIEGQVADLLDELRPLFVSPLSEGREDPLDLLLAGRRDVDDLGASLVDRLALVAAAATARESVLAGRSVPPGHLAALAGVSGRLVRAAGLRRDRAGAVRAEAALAWLRARGTPLVAPSGG